MLAICKSRKAMSISKVLVYRKIITVYLKAEDDLELLISHVWIGYFYKPQAME